MLIYFRVNLSSFIQGLLARKFVFSQSKLDNCCETYNNKYIHVVE